MMNQTKTQVGGRRQGAEQAIQFAMQGRWEEAEALNRRLIALYPDDVDGYNRLGKALAELGRYAEARESYTKTLELDATNSIARKNLSRLAALGEAPAPPASSGEKVDPHLFVEETGKTGVTTLQRPSAVALARMTAGDRVYLRRQDSGLVAENNRGEYLGGIETRVALRLAKLMDAGNEYAAAIASVRDHTCRVIIKETYQHPSQAGKLSFPPVGPEGFRPYTKETLLHYDLEEEEGSEEEQLGNEDWEGNAETVETGDARLYGRLRRAESDEKDDDEE